MFTGRYESETKRIYRNNRALKAYMGSNELVVEKKEPQRRSYRGMIASDVTLRKQSSKSCRVLPNLLNKKSIVFFSFIYRFYCSKRCIISISYGIAAAGRQCYSGRKQKEVLSSSEQRERLRNEQIPQSGSERGAILHLASTCLYK